MIYALQANTIAQLLQMSLEKMLSLDFRDEEDNKTDMLKYYAFAIYQPQHALMLEYFDDDWENFPLRWCIAHLPIPLVKTLFSMFKEGKNISEYFIISFQGDGVDRIVKLLSNPLLYYRFYKLSQIKKSIIEEAIDCYKQKSMRLQYLLFFL